MPAVQAALSGYSDLPMRRVARAHGARFCFNEVVLDRLVVEKGKIQRLTLDVPDDDHPVGGQLMGADPDYFGAAANAMVEAGYDLVDINFGCPVNKVLGRCRGGYHLGQPEVALQIVKEVVQACAGRVPVTVKMRRGVNDTKAAEADFFRILDGAFALGIAAVTVHGRTVQQKYVGDSSWEFLRRVKQHLGDQVMLGSGDLYTAPDVLRMMEQTGVDGVTVARGCIGNPWIFRQIEQLLAGQEPMQPDLLQQREALQLYCGHALDYYAEAMALRRLRTQAIKYGQRHPHGAQARADFVKMRSLADFNESLNRWYPMAQAVQQ